ncbi:uncharacterized protein [Drosophila bipectinata]|uniref:uncharacterized protein n=1 Tax=Drosophila bipectinata TaxID=42026 RepID=UPI0007E83C7D|nr:uncharacterized protein LOC108122524 [Drosophila bipectinata]
MRKTWHKPFHKRKAWNTVSRRGKLVYYMQPLVDHFFEVWMQALPFPTLLKFVYTGCLVFFILLPILYPMFVLLLYYGIFQYVAERHTGAVMPDNWDLLGAVANLWHFEITNKKYQLFVTMYIDRYRVIITAISSTVDYIRMALGCVF